MEPHFFVSGIWKSPQGFITHLYVHENGKNGFGKGTKSNLANVVKLIKQGRSFATLKWSYQAAKWMTGEKFVIIKDNGGEHLRTCKDVPVTDQLSNLINLAPFDLINTEVPLNK
jgi:hypothetical protein